MIRTKGKKRNGTSRKQAGAAGDQAAVPMSEAAGDGLTDELVMVVVQLTELAFRGDAHSARALVGVSSDESGRNKPEAPIGFSQALAWKQEPEWEGESTEAEAETASGSREPEN